jgi:hypothetical protein
MLLLLPSLCGPSGILPPAERTVFLAGNLSEEQLLCFTANIAASGQPGTLLLDSSKASPYIRAFLAAYQPHRIVPVGPFPEGIADLEQRLKVKTAPAYTWQRGPPVALLKSLFGRARQVVITPAQPRTLLLHASCLAGALHAPLLITHGEKDENKELHNLLDHWQTEEVLVAGNVKLTKVTRGLSGVRLVKLKDEDAVAAACLQQLLKKGPVKTLVVANPADTGNDLGGMSTLAPWIAVQRRAALLLTNPSGENVAALVQAALKTQGLAQADTVILVANREAIPTEKRPNPIPEDKDPYIETEPLAPRGDEPFSFALGRLFHEDRAVVALMLARQQLLARPSQHKVLVVSNSGGGLPLLETFSRNTAREYQNAGYETTTLFGREVTRDKVRRLLPQQTIFLWEGHHSTLISSYRVHQWPEPLRPSLIFLQSCLALTEAKVQPFLQRGAVGVIGSPARTYSASGGAFALAFSNALLYEKQPVGAALRHARNFMLAYALLKEKRLGDQAKLTGANIRAAWAFTLWGDPTLHLPPPDIPDKALLPINHQVTGNTIVVALPQDKHEKVVTRRYQSNMLPNGRLAGLLSKSENEENARLVPFIFVEVHLPQGPADKVPRLRSALPGRNWVFCWDQHRRCGYLLLIPRAKDQEAIRFHVEWQNPE